VGCGFLLELRLSVRVWMMVDDRDYVGFSFD